MKRTLLSLALVAAALLVVSVDASQEPSSPTEMLCRMPGAQDAVRTEADKKHLEEFVNALQVAVPEFNTKLQTIKEENPEGFAIFKKILGNADDVILTLQPISSEVRGNELDEDSVLLEEDFEDGV